MGVQRLRVGMAGLGRVGKFHAMNFLERTPRAELAAAFTPDTNELAWGRVHLEPHGVTLYDNYDEMLKHPGLEAVAIGTATSVHAEEAIKAIEQDLHVLCEKPLSIDIEVVSANRDRWWEIVADHLRQCKAVVAAAKKRPHLKVMCGFSRRFDECVYLNICLICPMELGLTCRAKSVPRGIRKDGTRYDLSHSWSQTIQSLTLKRSDRKAVHHSLSNLR